MMHKLTVESYSGRTMSSDPTQWDLHPDCAVYNERDVLVLWVYKTVGINWAFHLLVGKASPVNGGWSTLEAARVAGMAALRKVKGYEEAPIIREDVR